MPDCEVHSMSTSTVKKIESLLPLLSADEQLSLLQKTDQLGRAKPGPPQPLRGDWKDKFPADLDLDAALAEIRTGWQNDVESAARG
jgi:hypothetical protein